MSNPPKIENLETVIERHEKVIEQLQIGRINKRTKRTRNNKKIRRELEME